MSKKEILSGNVALAEAAVRAGCRFFAGYPITPQTTVTEYLSGRMPEAGGEFVQAESEVSAINMLLGASAVGARVMTATSCQGLSLMTEGLSSMCAGRIPAVVVDVQRGGAGSGSIAPSQCDYSFVTRSMGHGGLHAYVLGPATIQELVDITFKAFDIADQERTPVIILTDGVMGLMMEAVSIPDPLDKLPKRDWIITGREDMRPKKLTQDNVKPAPAQEIALRQYDEQYKRWESEPLVEELYTDDAEVIIAAWGTVARVARTALKNLRDEGYRVGMIRPISLYPFPTQSLRKLDPAKVRGIVVAEHAMPAQMLHDVDFAVQGKIPLESCTHSAGVLLTPDEIADAVRKAL
ncbi:MAG TPA: hypothetical protein VN369_05155 [Terriglobales bacterium]|nr:hypothetical protein [Terriglobales bacterium]